MVDGNDVDAVHTAAAAAVERVRSGGGPYLLEARTMRMLGHAIHDGAEYVPSGLLEKWKKRDPVVLYERKLLDEGIVDQAYLDESARRCREITEDAVAFAESSEWPDPAAVEEGVFAP